MIECRIDNQVVALRGANPKMPTYDASKLHSVAAWREGSEMVVEVVSTPESDRMFSFAYDLNRAVAFNDELHWTTLYVDGVELYRGVATLLGVEHEDGERYYRLRVRSGGGEWADMVAQTSLKESGVELDMALTPIDIESTWSGDCAVRFLPLRRDRYPEPTLSNAWLSYQALMPNDYHPFISVKHLIESIARRSGYTIHSQWLDSDVASKLMISGAYRQVESAAAERDMGFKAYRTYNSTATANGAGYVFGVEPQSASNVGAIVDSASADAHDAEGRIYGDAYNHGALTFENGQPLFVPKREISVAYEFHVRYITDYRIASSSKLKGFDRVRLGVGCDVELTLDNPFEDMRSKLEPNMAYKLYIFDYDPNSTYMLRDIGEVGGPVCDVVTPEGCRSVTRLLVKRSGSNIFMTYTGDWALYPGYVEPTGRRQVEFTVRTPYKSLTASAQERFYDVAFYGAEEGQQLTLCSGCSVRPLFSGNVGYGDAVCFEDVANHNLTQQQLVEAVAHMFNLCIYSYEPTRSLIIEPYDNFYDGGVVDWRQRQLSNEWSIVEGAPTQFQHTRLGYIAGDGVVMRDNNLSDKEFGTWTRANSGYGSKQGVDVRTNPLFHPTMSTTGFLRNASSAEVLTVGDRDKVEESEYVEPRVVLYHGLVKLPSGEKWSSVGNPQLYPHAAFHSASSGQTLCFEDRDGCTGLHKYYDNELRTEAERCVLRCKIRIPISDYLELFDPHSSKASVRSLFRLRVEGGESLFRLEAIEDYDYDRGVATCLFGRMLYDR